MGTSVVPPPADRPAWLPRDEWPFAINWLPLRSGEHVHYVDEGRGPALVFVHAGFWCFVWRDVIARLSRRFRCIAIDFPGHGLAGPGTGVARVSGYARVLEEVVAALAPGQATFVLHDLGGPVGLRVAADVPERVAGIVLTQTFAWPPAHARLRWALRVFGSRGMEELDRWTNFIPRLSAGAFGVGRRLSPAGRQAFLGPFRRPGPRRAFHRLMRDAVRADGFLADLERAVSTRLGRHPVLTVFGERNDPFDFQGRFRTMLPGVTQRVVRHANHFPMADDPGAFASHLETWWEAAVGGE